MGDPDRLVSRPAACGVRQDAVAVPIDHVEDRLLVGVVEIEAPQRDRDQLAARRLERAEHGLVGSVLACAKEKA